MEVRVERIEEVVDDIRRDVKAMDTRMAGMDNSISVRMARVEALMENVGYRVVSLERKAEKAENRPPWLIMIAVIVASGIPPLITKILS